MIAFSKDMSRNHKDIGATDLKVTFRYNSINTKSITLENHQ